MSLCVVTSRENCGKKSEIDCFLWPYQATITIAFFFVILNGGPSMWYNESINKQKHIYACSACSMYVQLKVITLEQIKPPV